MTPRYTHLLALVALGMLMASGPAFAQTDYDTDNDNLIDITSLLQLNAIRYDLNGDGAVANTDTMNYNAAFPNAMASMGCAATCTGYELMSNLDFDTNGDDTITVADDYPNWDPIVDPGNDNSGYTAIFEGNGHTISRLTITDRNSRDVGLFDELEPTGIIRNVGIIDANIRSGGALDGYAPLVGYNARGTIIASYARGGSVTATMQSSSIGGLTGRNSGSIIASYSTVTVIGGNHTRVNAGGLTGTLETFLSNIGRITASYATGAVSATGNNATRGGLVGNSPSSASVIASSYCTSGSCIGSNVGGSLDATTQTATALQTPTAYTGIYANWNIDLNDDRVPDNPWNFGTASQHPTLNTPSQRVADHDSDNDGLIDVTSLLQLNAIRYDLNGDGLPTGTNADTIAYASAFPGGDITASSGRMGCPSAGCNGYELLNNLDFDENNDGAITSADATYWNSGAGWLPIGTNANRYAGNFKGNGYTINNLFINRGSTHLNALFSAITGRVETLGVTNATVTGNQYTGILVAVNAGTIVACYTSGAVSGSAAFSGGLIAYLDGTLTTSYSTASVSGANRVGGLVGAINSGSLANSYSTGNVSATFSGVGGLLGHLIAGTVSNNFWDTSTSNQATSVGGSGVVGKTTSDLQSPTTYGATTSDTYYGWNANLDGQAGNDDPWTFGTAYQYPVLKYDGMDTAVQFAAQPVRYDTDSDGLIEVSSLAQLNAMRWDLNGDGAIDASASTSDTTAYNTAFPRRDSRSGSRMGCPSACTGYELLNDLDFDENNDGAITSADATYWNSGNGWQPIGTQSSAYATTFKGNGHIINNLFISRGSISYVGLFGNNGTGGRIETLGVTNAKVTGSHGSGILAGGNEGGTVVVCFSTGSVSGNQYTGGLVGYSTTGTISTSYSTASVSGSSSVGGLVGYHAGSVTDTYSIGRVSGSGANVSGLVGSKLNAASTSRSFWDTQTSNRSNSNGGGTGKTTSELQSQTTYGATSSDPYFNWNVNLDGQPGNDDPWTFGAMDQYPVLKYAGFDTTAQFKLQPAVVTLALTPSSISENGGMSTVTATLAHPLSAATTITVRPVAGAYTVAADSTITIAAGSTANASDTVVITAVDNTQDAPNRDVDMSVVADNAQGSVVRPTEITITDDDAPPRLSISSPSAVEGTALTFTVRLNAVSGKEVTVAYADAGTGSATSGTDYTALTAGTLTFAAGTTTTSQTIAVSVTGDSDDEPNETVIVTLSNAVNATFDGGATSLTGTGTIIDDDGMPALSIGSPSVIEGATGATLTFRVYLRPMHTAPVTVAYADAGTGTATSGTDYTALTAGTLTFAMGDTIQTIPVSVTDDSNDEQNETVIVELSSATNATISTAQGTGTIIDDETPSANLDVDGDGRVRLFSDIILVIRYVLFFREEALLRGNVIEPTATRKTAQEIEPYLDTLVNQNILDVDGDGDVRLFSDIILIIRYVLFFRNEALVRGNVIEQNATRTTAQAIEPYIRSLYPASHFQ